MPLEGVWWAGCDIADKSRYEWAIMLRQPDFVTSELYEATMRYTYPTLEKLLSRR